MKLELDIYELGEILRKIEEKQKIKLCKPYYCKAKKIDLHILTW